MDDIELKLWKKDMDNKLELMVQELRAEREARNKALDTERELREKELIAYEKAQDKALKAEKDAREKELQLEIKAIKNTIRPGVYLLGIITTAIVIAVIHNIFFVNK